MTEAELLTQLKEALAGSSEHTIGQFSSIMKRFYRFSSGNFTRSEVVGYIRKLERGGYAAGTRRLHFGVLKRAFQLAGVEWPFGRKPPAELPVSVAEWDVKAPPIALADLKLIINGAKDGAFPRDWTALIGLSSIYGLRRIELMELAPECMNLDNGTLRVVTAKHGRAREHLIPEVLKPYLTDYPFRKYSEFKLTQGYHLMREAVGLPYAYGEGFHGVRRTLVTALLYIFPEPIVSDFMRWKKSSMSMVRHYWTPSSPQVVERTVFGLEPFPAYGGELVYGKHPFLEFWG